MTGQLCHYATHLDSHTGCEVSAVVRRGTVALCTACDALRSTVGKGQAATPVPALSPVSLLDWISQAHARLTSAEAEQAAAVARARQHGHSRAAIADRLGTTRQAAQQRFSSPHGNQHQTRGTRSPTAT